MINQNMYDDDPPTLAEMLCATAELVREGGKVRPEQVAKVTAGIREVARQRNQAAYVLAVEALPFLVGDAFATAHATDQGVH